MISRKIMSIYKMGVFKRSIIILVIFQAVLWTVFGISYSLTPESWNEMYEARDVESKPDSLLVTFLFIIGNNLVLYVLIVVGNMFVRFGIITPGLLILFYQGVMIGFIAGSNSFEFPFASVYQANIQFLKVGLWETISYSLICGVTLTKSLNTADTFPARQWSEVRKLRDISFSKSERVLAAVSVLLLIIAAYIEAFLITTL